MEVTAIVVVAEKLLATLKRGKTTRKRHRDSCRISGDVECG